ncbi:hypothetical protein Zmor_008527 [Zophobas morio]|uniref:Uncharacterized protein n=1 Tax=Zophobas morio TaxID=2755281 RepID=A0AA38IWP6_9CUCU|nr:hypothetical protein Zmor_008527 [Zophobas morio]
MAICIQSSIVPLSTLIPGRFRVTGSDVNCHQSLRGKSSSDVEKAIAAAPGHERKLDLCFIVKVFLRDFSFIAVNSADERLTSSLWPLADAGLIKG